MAKILAVDDEKDIHTLIKRYAEREGHEVTTASDGAEAVEICGAEDFDIIIMDAMMPEMDGFTACKEIKKTKDIPVLMLSARGEEYDKLFGFEVGVDDYVVKPFSPKELMARVNVIVSRHKKADDASDKDKRVCIGGIELDTLGRTVYIDGERTEFTAKEYDLLLYFARHNGAALSRDNILNAVWGYDYFGEDRTVDWQIKHLRAKLGNYRDCIKTIRGVGYKLEI
ncbi:MAG: response regulator transcription factor [Clostridia bacterium]|nr:response regulator transcription factor [Clostridia bacterium]MBQ6529475.1 response regulator transcription factor [Clostridia bacterium]